MGLLRLLLALAVVGDHVGPPLQWLHLSGGTIAVEAFFIVSGFYMQMILSQKYSSARSFYMSRALRIYPTYWIIAAIAFAAWPVNGFNQIGRLGWQPAALVFLSNITIAMQDWLLFLGNDSGKLYFSGKLDPSEIPLSAYLIIRPSWTLALEMSFYALAPLLARWNSARLAAIITVGTAARLATYFAGYHDDPWYYRFFPFELPLFLVGMLSFRMMPANWARPERITSKAFSLVAVIALIAFGRYCLLHWRPEYSFLAALPTALVIPVAFKAFESSGIDRFVGDLSYPIYLVHFPIIQFVSTDYAVVVCLSVAISTLIVLILERPLDRFRHHVAYSSWSGCKKCRTD